MHSVNTSIPENFEAVCCLIAAAAMNNGARKPKKVPHGLFGSAEVEFIPLLQGQHVVTVKSYGRIMGTGIVDEKDI